MQDLGDNMSYIRSFDPCAYAFVGEENLFKFNGLTDLSATSFKKRIEATVPLVLEWAIGNLSCLEAESTKSFACQLNSNCVSTTRETGGYRCVCKEGYEGNPYLPPGCQGKSRLIYEKCYNHINFIKYDRIVSDVLQNLKNLRSNTRGVPVGSKPIPNFIYRPVQSTIKTNKVPAKPKVTKAIITTSSTSNSFDALNSLVDDDDCGGMNPSSSQEAKQGEGNGKNDVHMSVPSSSYYNPYIAVISSSNGSSPVTSGSLNTTPLAEKINKIKIQMLDEKLIVVDDDGKPLKKVDCDPVKSDSKSEVEVAYDETV
ncbi:hypothetical protein Tco_0173035 [Tanacetum coccineum]